MLKKSKLFLGVILLASIAFVSCNSEADKKADAPAADSTKVETMEQKTEPAKMDTAKAAMDTTMGSTKPVVPTK